MTENGTASRRLELITLVSERLAESYTGQMPTIRQIDAAASSARFPIERINGRRYVDMVATLPLIAKIYGLTPKEQPKAARRRSESKVSVAA